MSKGLIYQEFGISVYFYLTLMINCIKNAYNLEKLKKVKSMLFKKGRFLAKNSLKVDFFSFKINRELIFYVIIINIYLILTKKKTFGRFWEAHLDLE